MVNKGKIFLIEDDNLMSKMYSIKFKKEGYEIIVADNGESGLKTLKDGNFVPDVILLDIMMPKMNGFQVLEILKKDLKLKNIPVILLTNLAGREDEIKKGLNLGAIDYMVKSNFTPQEAVERIESHLKKKKINN